MADKTKGWLSLLRSIQEHWLWKDRPFSKGQAWIDLLLSVNFEKKKIYFDGILVEVDRGQTITSQLKLSERWGWGREKVKHFLNTLQSDTMISYKTSNKASIITICNYNDLQIQASNKPDSKPTTKRQQTKQQTDTNNNDNNNNNDNKKEHIADKPLTPIKKEPDPEFASVVFHICDTWKKKKNAPYPYVYGKHDGIIKGLIRNYEHAGVKALWDCYLNTAGNNDFYRIAGWSIEVFATSMPGLLDTGWRSIRQKYETKSNGFSTPSSILKEIVSGTNKN